MAKFKPSILTLALATAGLSASLFSTTAIAQEKELSEQIEISQVEPDVPTTEEQVDESQQAEQVTDSSVPRIPTEQPPSIENTLVITGYRGSLIRSLNEKRYADTVSEQLSSDDLGSLPDISIADALTRLPGISAVRTGGQAAEINIRGMSGGFVLATLNGREQVSTSGTRSVEFDQYPSELISSGAVYKSQKASLLEGGVAGTVDLNTASALHNRLPHTFNFNVRGMTNDRADEIFDADSSGKRLSFSYQGKFANDTFGISAGFARLDQPSVATQFIGLNYNDLKDVDGLVGDTEGPTEPTPCLQCEYVSEGFEMQHKGGTEVRDGYVVALEWFPSDTFALKADAFISKFESEQFARGFRVKFGGPTAHFYNPQVFQNNVVGANVVRTGQSYTRVEIVNDDDTKVDEVKNYGVNAKWNLTEQFMLTADASYSAATSNFQNRLLWSLVAQDANAANPIIDPNVSINYQLNGLNLPDVAFNQDFTDLDKVMVSKYGTYPFEYTDTLKAFKLDGIYDVIGSEWFSSIEVGMRYSERNYDKERSLFEYGSDGSFLTSQPPFRLSSAYASAANFAGEFSHFPGYLAINIDNVLSDWLPGGNGQAVQTWGVNAAGELDNTSSWSVLESGEVFEDVTSGYFQANIDTDLSDLPIAGNIGLRVVRTEQMATTLQDVGGDPLLGAQNIVDEAGVVNDQYAPGLTGISYTDFLPQLNLNFKVSDNSQLRFAAARVMSRAPIQRLAAELTGRVDPERNNMGEVVQVRFNGNSTNSPTLKPFMVNQYDLSYEYYFKETEGAFIAALFYKDVKSFIDTFPIVGYDFAANGFNIPQTWVDPEHDDSSGIPATIWTVENGTYSTAVNNTNGGYIRGLELAYTQVFSMLPGAWSGLGVNTSYAYTESEVSKITDFGGSTINLPLDGLSRDVLSATLFYEYRDIATRINARHRSRFVSEQIAVNEQTVFFDSETVMDYQASYKLSDRSQILFQVNNLTDQPTKSYFGSQQQTGTIQFFGRQFFLGMSYQL